MDSLIGNRSLDNWYKTRIIPLALMFGTVESILNLKRYEIEELFSLTSDEDVKKLIKDLK